jgi:hypothetical protein
MSDEEMKETHKNDTWSAYILVEKDFNALSDYQQYWFKIYFPGEYKNASKNAT